MLSKRTDGARGSSTLLMLPQAAKRMLDIEKQIFDDDAFREAAYRERSYDTRFSISKRQYNFCFTEKDGFSQVVSQMLTKDPEPEDVASMELNILDYLIRGPLADEVMRQIRAECEDMFFEEQWHDGGLLIVDNATTFHARDGGNEPPLQRNFCE